MFKDIPRECHSITVISVLYFSSRALESSPLIDTLFGFLLRSNLLGRCTLESFFDGFLPLCDMFFISFGVHLFVFEEETEWDSFVVTC